MAGRDHECLLDAGPVHERESRVEFDAFELRPCEVRGGVDLAAERAERVPDMVVYIQDLESDVHCDVVLRHSLQFHIAAMSVTVARSRL